VSQVEQASARVATEQVILSACRATLDPTYKMTSARHVIKTAKIATIKGQATVLSAHPVLKRLFQLIVLVSPEHVK
jgi:hypothetical protein